MYIGVDVRDTKIAIGLVSDKGELSLPSSFPIDPKRGSETVILDIIYVIKSISETVPLELFNDQLSGIGIGVHSEIDKNNENNVGHVNNKLEIISLREVVGRHFDIPVFVEGHAIAESLADNEIRALKGAKSNEAGIVAAAMLCKYLK